MLERTSEVVRAIGGNAGSLATSSDELSAVAQQLGASAEETSAQSTTASAAAEQVSANVNTVAAGADERSEERLGGNGGVSTSWSRGSASHTRKNKKNWIGYIR